MGENPLTACWKNYHRPASIDDAVSLLRQYDGRARVIGGGTDLLVKIRRGLRRPLEAMVDASGIPGLNRITRDAGFVVIGCGVTHTDIVTDDSIGRYGTCLAESCGVIGGPQVRNVGTLAGNVAHALPAGDGTIGLLGLGGEAEVAGIGGTRWLPLEQAFVGPGRSAIDRHREVLTRLRFKPTGPGEGTAFHRVMRPQGLCLPIISMAVRLQLDDEDVIAAARIAMGPVGPVPYLAEPAMEALVGGPPSNEQFENAVGVVLDSVSLRASKYRATHEYRARMIRTYLPAVLRRAADRAAAGNAAPEGAGS